MSSPGWIAEAANVLSERLAAEPRVHLVLGSGLGGVVDRIDDAVEVAFSELPGFPPPAVAGHEGRFVGGHLGGRHVLAQSGRYHFYEGVGADTVLGPVRVGGALGIQTVVLTNAAGGIRRDLRPGALMAIDDHLNLMFRSPLAGAVQPGDIRFPDMSQPYDQEILALSEAVALELSIPLSRGTYAAVLGPSYETPAEIRALALAGADAVGMSTVPEAIAARAQGQRVVAFSMISNRAAGLSDTLLSHDEVMSVGRVAGRSLGELLTALIPLLPPLGG